MGRYTLTIFEVLGKYTDLFDFDYDDIDGIDKQTLEDYFLDKYGNREIAYETYEMWRPKFRMKWQLMIKKYKPLFEKEIDVWRNYARSVESSTSVTGSGVNKEIPAPIDGATVDVPRAITKSDVENDSDSSVISQGQTKSDVAMITDYIKLNSIMYSFLNEFNNLMFGRY